MMLLFQNVATRRMQKTKVGISMSIRSVSQKIFWDAGSVVLRDSDQDFVSDTPETLFARQWHKIHACYLATTTGTQI